MIERDPGKLGEKRTYNKRVSLLNKRWRKLPRHPSITNGFKHGVIGKKKLKKPTAADYKLIAKVGTVVGLATVGL